MQQIQKGKDFKLHLDIENENPFHGLSFAVEWLDPTVIGFKHYVDGDLFSGYGAAAYDLIVTENTGFTDKKRYSIMKVLKKTNGSIPKPVSGTKRVVSLALTALAKGTTNFYVTDGKTMLYKIEGNDYGLMESNAIETEITDANGKLAFLRLSIEVI